MKSNHSLSKTDDFELNIAGIGPGIARRLHQADILTYTRLATLTPEEILPLVNDIPGMTVEKIAKLDWPGQARKLAQESLPAESQPGATPSGNRQHDASFTVKLLLNEDHSVRGMRVVDNRSKAEDQWAEWDEGRLIDFIVQSADLRLPVAAATEPERAIPVPAEPVPAVALATEPTSELARPASLGGTLHLRGLEVVPADTNRPGRVFRHGLPLGVYLNLDLTKVITRGDGPIEYTATIYAKSLGHGPREVVGAARNTILQGTSRIVRIASRPLRQGSYRLEAIVTLNRPSDDPTAAPGPKAFLDGGVFQVL